MCVKVYVCETEKKRVTQHMKIQRETHTHGETERERHTHTHRDR